MPASPLGDQPTLTCRECGRDAPGDGPQYCAWCFGPVAIELATDLGPAGPLRSAIGAGPGSLARYRPLLPAGLVWVDDVPGWTPLLPAPSLGAALGLEDLWLKDETVNPTGSFKDRVVDLAAARAARLGLSVLACTSTGNLARATAATAARRGMRSVVLVPDDVDASVADDLAARGAVVVPVRGGYDAASRLGADAAADLPWGWVNVTLRPWYELGARTCGWEIAEQLGWQLPDRVVAPMASGALAVALHESMAHLVELGLVTGTSPRLTVAQPGGCAPVATAFASGARGVTPLRSPHTVAESLEMGDPTDGQAVLDTARATGGAVVAAPEEQILDAARLVADTEGIEVEPAGGVAVAALAQLVETGVIVPEQRIVVMLTGGPAPVGTESIGARVVPGGLVTGTIEPSMSALAGSLPPDLSR